MVLSSDSQDASPGVARGAAAEFLIGELGEITDLEPLSGGFWSSAFSFRHEGRELVVRFGSDRDWFEADRAAMAVASPDLPVPPVLDIGDAFGGVYAISERRHGVNLEDVRPDQSEATRRLLGSLLGALFAVPKHPGLPVAYHWRSDPPFLTWREWLRECLVDDPSKVAHGWRAVVASQPELDRAYRAAESRVLDLIESCPERRDLVHGDLLHANVLVAEDASRPTAIFSWKCSVRGDFLFDAAWCTFCGDMWFPGIAAANPWGVVRDAAWSRGAAALADAATRHHCYELHIGLTALAFKVWVGDAESVKRIADHLAVVLELGPRGI